MVLVARNTGKEDRDWWQSQECWEGEVVRLDTGRQQRWQMWVRACWLLGGSLVAEIVVKHLLLESVVAKVTEEYLWAKTVLELLLVEMVV